jgi:hypothetical protein
MLRCNNIRVWLQEGNTLMRSNVRPIHPYNPVSVFTISFTPDSDISVHRIKPEAAEQYKAAAYAVRIPGCDLSSPLCPQREVLHRHKV